jgi:hypothetical protein
LAAALAGGERLEEAKLAVTRVLALEPTFTISGFFKVIALDPDGGAWVEDSVDSGGVPAGPEA